MNDLTKINKAITDQMSEYMKTNGQYDNVLFESKILFQDSSVMFTMMMKKGALQVEPFKLVFPGLFIKQCEEVAIVNLICNLFKNVITEYEKFYSTSNLSDEFSRLNVLGK